MWQQNAHTENTRVLERKRRPNANASVLGTQCFSSKVPEGHHPRGTMTLREALRGNLPLRGLCGGLSEGSLGFSEGSAGSLRGSAGVHVIFRGFRG